MKIIGKKWSQSNLRFDSCLEGLRKAVKNSARIAGLQDEI
jgi:hypothetical protein